MKRWTPEGAALTELILEVFRVHGDLIATGDGIAGEFGQSSARWQVLGALEEEPGTVPAIARLMGLTRQAVQRTVDLLADDGIVEFVPNPAHRRSQIVRMTDAGRRIYDKISAEQVVWINGVAEELSHNERDIRKALKIITSLRTELERPRTQVHKKSRPHDVATARRKERR